MKIAILGAGHGGQAMAADLTLGGHEIRLAAVPEHSSGLKIITAFGGIYAEGVTSSGVPTGFANISMVTTDIQKALKGAEFIMVVVPAFAQEEYMREIIKYADCGSITVFNPGKFASLRFAQMVKEAKREKDLLWGETDCLIYAAKIKGVGHVNIKAVKKELSFAAMPSVKTAEILMSLIDVFSQYKPVYNTLQTSIDDPGSIVHPITTLLNASRIEQMGPYRNSHYDITPSLGRAIDAVDAERLNLAKMFKYETFSFLEVMNLYYGVKAPNTFEGMLQISAHNIQMAPENLKHRYVTEELPFALVPISTISKLVDNPTPNIDAIIQIGCMLNNENYWESGRNAKNLGLEGMNIKDLLHYVTYGE